MNITIVRSLDGLREVFDIRASKFLAVGEPYNEEFDCLDLVNCVHLLCRTDREEAIGTMRVRTLRAGIVAWERFAILQGGDVPPIKVLHSLVNGARRFSENSGHAVVLGSVADERLQKFWERSQRAVFTNEPPTLYNDVEYRHMRIPLSPKNTDPTAALLDAEPEELLTREG